MAENKTTRLKKLKNVDNPSRLCKTASPVLELAHLVTKGGSLIGLSARIINWEPWYTVYQEHDYETSSFYDGPDWSIAARKYQDVLLAFKGAEAAEKFQDKVGHYMKQIKSFVKPYENGWGNENTYIKEIMPKFLGFLDK